MLRMALFAVACCSRLTIFAVCFRLIRVYLVTERIDEFDLLIKECMENKVLLRAFEGVSCLGDLWPKFRLWDLKPLVHAYDTKNLRTHDKSTGLVITAFHP